MQQKVGQSWVYPAEMVLLGSPALGHSAHVPISQQFNLTKAAEMDKNVRSFDASSPKLCALLQCLEQELGTNETSCGMVFVSKAGFRG